MAGKLGNIVKVNSLAVAKRWHGQLKEKYHESHHKKIVIWESQPQGRSRYQYKDNTLYVVGHRCAVEFNVSHLGKRIA